MKYGLRRMVLAIMTLLVVSVLVFAGCEILPGDMAEVSLGEFATPEAVAALRAELGLNRPPLERYGAWVSGMVRGDLGTSVLTKTPVWSLIGPRIWATTVLCFSTAIIAFPLAIAGGMYMALKPGSATDRFLSVVVVALASLPEFLLATALVLVFAVMLRLTPAVSTAAGSDIFSTFRALALPVTTLVLGVAAQVSRLTRSTLVNMNELAYVEMATLKGLPRRRVVFRHVFRNAIGPIANVVALNLAYLISGVVVVETVFAYPGLAALMVDSVASRDLPVVQACAMIFCAVYVVLMAIADWIAYAANPRLGTH